MTERVPAARPGSRGPLLVLGLGLGYVLLLVTAFAPTAIGFAVSALLVLGLEVAVTWWSPFPAWVLSRVQTGVPIRALLAGVGVLVLGVRTNIDAGPLLGTVVGLLWLHLLRFAASALAEAYSRQRRMPILLRGIDPKVRIPRSVPAWLGGYASELASWSGLLFVAVAGLGYATGTQVGGVLAVGAVLTSVPALAVTGLLATAVVRMRQLSRARWQEAAYAALADLSPRVVLYHAGGVDTLYQVRSWLPTLERLVDPDDSTVGTPLLVLRDPDAFARLGPTSLPVICIQPSTMMMGLPLPELRLVLYASHATGNLHMLRRPGVRHAFVGHGDSDKPVTLNPFLRAYTELWVAGPASAERFQRAESSGLRLDSTRVLQVGRPQLDEISDAAARSGGAESGTPGTDLVTVLYAPTWEGFEDEPDQTSVGELGIELLRALLARADVRVLYRPHPMAGKRDPAVGAAHRRILAMLGAQTPDRTAGPKTPAVHRVGGQPSAQDPLAYAAVEPAKFGSRLAQDRERREWTARRLAEPGHQVVAGPDHDLLACFQAADLLLCDVSSLITEFLITAKPYGVTNPGGRSRQEFEQRYPSVAGGYLIGDTAAIDELCAAVRSPRQYDSSATRRALLAERLLGPSPAFESFREAARRGTASRNRPTTP